MILSATADVEFYERLYPEHKFRLRDVGLIQQEGSIIQIENFSFSKAQLTDERRMKIARGFTGDKNVITHKDYIKSFPNAKAYFGNLRGMDELRVNVC